MNLRYIVAIGVYVQLDMCKFGKRKYHREHRVEGYGYLEL